MSLRALLNDEPLEPSAALQALLNDEPQGPIIYLPPCPSPSSLAVPAIASIDSNIPRTSTSPPDVNEDYKEYIQFFPDNTEPHRQLRVAMHHIMVSDWKIRNEFEPSPEHLLQFTLRPEGSLTFTCLMYHKKGPCKGRWARPDRMLAHVRTSIDLRPFLCKMGNDTGWYVLHLLLELNAYHFILLVCVGSAIAQWSN
jgi:hypothetical protein